VVDSVDIAIASGSSVCNPRGCRTQEVTCGIVAIRSSIRLAADG